MEDEKIAEETRLEDRPIVEHSYSWYIIYREPQDITEVQ